MQPVVKFRLSGQESLATCGAGIKEKKSQQGFGTLDKSQGPPRRDIRVQELCDKVPQARRLGRRGERRRSGDLVR